MELLLSLFALVASLLLVAAAFIYLLDPRQPQRDQSPKALASVERRNLHTGLPIHNGLALGRKPARNRIGAAGEDETVVRLRLEHAEEQPISGMPLDQITRDVIEPVRFPGSPANGNAGLRTLRRMLGKAVDWGMLQTAPRIKLLQEQGREILIGADAEAKLLASGGATAA